MGGWRSRPILPGHRSDRKTSFGPQSPGGDMTEMCRGPIRRREFLRLGTLALGGLSLADFLKARASAGESPRDASVILFWMWGGPSQLETYDLKPDAPSEYRGPFRPIATDGAGPRRVRALPAPGGARRQGLAHPVAPPHDVGAQRRVDRAADGQDPGQARPDLDLTLGASRFRHDRQQAAGPSARRPAALRGHPPAAVHDPADVPGGQPLGVRHGRPLEGGLSAPEPQPLGGRRRPSPRRSPRAARPVRPDAPRRGRLGPPGGPGRVPDLGAADADQPPDRRGLRPGAGGPAAPRPLRAAPLGPEHAARPPPGRGRRQRHHGRCAGPDAQRSLLQLGRPHQPPDPLGPGRRHALSRPVHGPGPLGA